ncbi:Biotin/lipoate A/B protein ligase [Geranomyces michiganensis]|nr:Biotin/lipoate A/B protein ligase [Geranomyces michiganensis]
MQEENVPLVRRRSGGGTVYHDIGNTNYTIIMPRETFDRRTNAELVVRGLHQLDVPASVNTRHDIVVEDKKISGSAYKLVNTRAYHHGTMLIDADLGALGRYLRPPPKNLVGKGVESVRSTVGKLRDYSYTVDHLSFCEAIAEEFCRSHGADIIPLIELTAKDIDRDPKIREYHEEITTWDWIYGQTPDFTHRLEQQFSWGTVDIILQVHRGMIAEAAVAIANAPELVAVAMRLAERLKDKQYSRAGIAAAFAFDDARMDGRIEECMQELAGWLSGAL